jgi:Stage III sporulation protein AC/AD protein family.
MMKLCGIAVCAVIFILVIKQIKPEFAQVITISASVILLGASMILIQPFIDFISNVINNTAYGTYMPVLLKALGIGLTAQTVADICRDSGETAIASKVELIGKLEIMLISLPLIESIITMSGEILK